MDAQLILALLTDGPAVTPVGAATASVVSYILGYGVLGIVTLAFAFRFIVPKGAIEDGRRDLLEENKRLLEEKERAEAQRDEALNIARVQLVPLLTSFTATTSALLPLLQEMVRYREGERDPRPRRDR